MQLAIGNRQVNLGIVAFPDDCNIVTLRVEMPVDAVVAGIERAIVIPADMQVVLRERHILDLRKRLDPVDALACSAQNPSLSSTDRRYICSYAFASTTCFRLRPGGYFIEFRHQDFLSILAACSKIRSA